MDSLEEKDVVHSCYNGEVKTPGDSSYMDMLRSKLPSHIMNLLLQPDRSGVDFNEFEEKSGEDEKSLSIMERIGKGDESNMTVGDEQTLQQGLVLEADDFRELMDRAVTLKTKEETMAWSMFSYKSKCRMYWNLVIIAFAMYNCIMIPI